MIRQPTVRGRNCFIPVRMGIDNHPALRWCNCTRRRSTPRPLRHPRLELRVVRRAPSSITLGLSGSHALPPGDAMSTDVSLTNMAIDPWPAMERDLTAADYFAMLEAALARHPDNPAKNTLRLQSKITSGRGVVENQHKNFCALLKGLGRTWIHGRRSEFSFKMSHLYSVIRWHLPYPGQKSPVHTMTTRAEFQQTSELKIESAPTPRNRRLPDELAQRLRIARKFDLAGRTQRTCPRSFRRQITTSPPTNKPLDCRPARARKLRAHHIRRTRRWSRVQQRNFSRFVPFHPRIYSFPPFLLPTTDANTSELGLSHTIIFTSPFVRTNTEETHSYFVPKYTK